MHLQVQSCNNLCPFIILTQGCGFLKPREMSKLQQAHTLPHPGRRENSCGNLLRLHISKEKCPCLANLPVCHLQLLL